MRGSGRTTRQLMDAVLYAKGGDTVVYVVPNAKMVDYCIALLVKADVLTHPAATWMPAARRLVFERPGGVLMVRSADKDPTALRGLSRLRVELDHACDSGTRQMARWLEFAGRLPPPPGDPT